MNDLKKIFKEELNKRKSKENTDLSKVQNNGWAIPYVRVDHIKKKHRFIRCFFAD